MGVYTAGRGNKVSVADGLKFSKGSQDQDV